MVDDNQRLVLRAATAPLGASVALDALAIESEPAAPMLGGHLGEGAAERIERRAVAVGKDDEARAHQERRRGLGVAAELNGGHAANLTSREGGTSTRSA